MFVLIQILIGVVVALHLYFLYLEMFAWTTQGPKVFRGFPKDLFVPTKAMAANQGLYNGFLAAGLVWTFFIGDALWQSNITIFFLACVVVAGVYGGMSVNKKIFLFKVYLQSLL